MLEVNGGLSVGARLVVNTYALEDSANENEEDEEEPEELDQEAEDQKQAIIESNTMYGYSISFRT